MVAESKREWEEEKEQSNKQASGRHKLAIGVALKVFQNLTEKQETGRKDFHMREGPRKETCV